MLQTFLLEGLETEVNRERSAPVLDPVPRLLPLSDFNLCLFIILSQSHEHKTDFGKFWIHLHVTEPRDGAGGAANVQRVSDGWMALGTLYFEVYVHGEERFIAPKIPIQKQRWAERP